MSRWLRISEVRSETFLKDATEAVFVFENCNTDSWSSVHTLAQHCYLDRGAISDVNFKTVFN